MKEIKIQEFYQKNQEEKLTVIDVREEDEFAEVHISGSRNLPLSQLESRYQELPQDQELYLICKAGRRSARAGAFLEEQGYQVINVAGGMDAYSKARWGK